jgi:hypothetical protein
MTKQIDLIRQCARSAYQTAVTHSISTAPCAYLAGDVVLEDFSAAGDGQRGPL